jgi:hypothetical protein
MKNKINRSNELKALQNLEDILGKASYDELT